MKTREVVEEIILPLTKYYKCSLVDFIVNRKMVIEKGQTKFRVPQAFKVNRKEKSVNTDNTTVFISHSWSCDFEGLVNSLEGFK